jgi:hypothetical protein
MDSTFTISIQNGRVVILDEKGKRLDRESAYVVIELLKRTYKPAAYIYLGYSTKRQLHKIGVSKNPTERAKKLGLRLIHVIPSYSRPDALFVEQELCSKFQRQGKCVSGEEWFNLEVEDVADFKKFRSAADCLGESLHSVLDEWWVEVHKNRALSKDASFSERLHYYFESRDLPNPFMPK